MHPLFVIRLDLFMTSATMRELKSDTAQCMSALAIMTSNLARDKECVIDLVAQFRSLRDISREVQY